MKPATIRQATRAHPKFDPLCRSVDAGRGAAAKAPFIDAADDLPRDVSWSGPGEPTPGAPVFMPSASTAWKSLETTARLLWVSSEDGDPGDPTGFSDSVRRSSLLTGSSHEACFLRDRERCTAPGMGCSPVEQSTEAVQPVREFRECVRLFELPGTGIGRYVCRSELSEETPITTVEQAAQATNAQRRFVQRRALRFVH